MKIKHIKYGKEKYLLLNELGAKLNLSFSSHLALGDKIIALDGINKKLLVSPAENGLINSFVIDLARAKSISVEKRYSTIKAGDLLKRKIEEFLESIYLMFDFGNNVENPKLSFYQRERDSIQDLPALERNARNWQMILSKIAGSKNNEMMELKSSIS